MTGNVSPPAPAPAPQPRRRKRVLLLLVAILVIASLPALALFRYATSPGPLSGPPRTIEISRGAGLRVIARHLEAIPPEERPAYEALAEQARRLIASS